MAALDGLYGFVYAGLTGVGIGIFRVAGTKLTGWDSAGCEYQGELPSGLDNDQIAIQVNVTQPAGSALVSGLSAMDVRATRFQRLSIPYSFADGRPFDVQVPGGSITMICRNAPAGSEIYENGFRIVPR